LIVALNLHIVARSNLRLITELARHIALSDPQLPSGMSPPHSAKTPFDAGACLRER
jgi:hypothetical protein